MKTRAKRSANVWRAAATDMANRLRTDWYNNLMLACPCRAPTSALGLWFPPGRRRHAHRWRPAPRKNRPAKN